MSGSNSEKFKDFAELLPNLKFHCVFDVGANVGNTIAETLNYHPSAIIHGFEPVRRTFKRLAKRFADDPRVHCHDFALGAESGEGLITARGTATGNRIVAQAPPRVPVETVRIRTGDEFSAMAGVERIEFLKIDTEGYDLDALRGFSAMLSNQRIDVFQAEVSMGPQNTKHVDFSTLRDFATSLGYWPFKIYNQAQEFDGRPIARRADAVFVSTICMEANKRPSIRKTLLMRITAGFSGR
jgi:FkbM family methyltransferase